MRVFACATDPLRGVERLVGSAARHGVAIRLLGAGERWAHRGEKLRAALPAVAAVPPDELVLLVDGYDVLFFAGTEELEARFACGDGRPVFNGERGFFCPAPWADEARRAFADDTVPYPFLNSGVLLGRASDVTALLHDAAAVVAEHRLTSDQAAFYRLALDAPERVAVDRRGELFCCTGAMRFRGWWSRRPPGLRQDGATLVDETTGGRPCLLHSPGRKDRYQERVYRASLRASPGVG